MFSDDSYNTDAGRGCALLGFVFACVFVAGMVAGAVFAMKGFL